MERYSGRVAVVTGASSGIGAVIAEDLVNAGMKVVGIARRVERVEELAQKLSGRKGKLYPLKVDVSKPDEIVKAFAWIDSNLGGVSVLVNNAAVLSFTGITEMDTEMMSTLVDTNVLAVAVGCREAISSMKKHNIIDGTIVNINSVAGHNVPILPGVTIGMYSATKYAVTALCKALRAEVKAMEGFKIRISSISPGGVNTDMLPQEFVNSNLAAVIQPQDVSRAVCFAIASPPEVCIVELTIQSTSEVV